MTSKPVVLLTKRMADQILGFLWGSTNDYGGPKVIEALRDMTMEASVSVPAAELAALRADAEAHAELQARCFDGGGAQSVFDAVKETRAELSRLRGLLGEAYVLLDHLTAYDWIALRADLLKRIEAELSPPAPPSR